MAKAKLQDLEIYLLSMQLAEKVWTIVVNLDFFTKDTLGKQWIRAIDSVSANISEGYGRYSFVEMRKFVRIARGSLSEHFTWLTKTHNRKLIITEEYESLMNDTRNLSVKINNYLSALDKQINSQPTANKA